MPTQLAMSLPAPEPAAGPMIRLFDYQEAALAAVWAAADRGVTRQLVVMPTGSGKTVTFAHLIRRVRAERAGARFLILVQRDELVTQSIAKLRQVDPALAIGVVKADRDEVTAEVMIASAQTLARPARLERLGRALPAPPVIISDEAHHDLAGSRRAVLEALGPALLVGFTATPMRGDGKGLGAVYQEIVYSLGMLALMARGRLAPLRGLRIDSEADLDAVRTTAGELNEGDLEDAVDTAERNELIVRSWQAHAAERRRTVAFCVTVAHARGLRDAFRAAGVPAEMVDGSTPADERAALLTAFHRGEIPVLTNCMVLTEGYDEPGIDCLLMARPTKSQGLYIQCVGRGARTADGKTDCLVVDFVDNTSRHKLITLPVLTADEGQDGSGGGARDERRNGEQIDFLELAQQRHRLRERAAVEVDLFGRSPYLWREVAGVHMAPAGRDAWLVLRPVGEGFRPYLVSRDAGYAVLTRPLFDRALDLGYAMGVAEAEGEPLVAGAGFVMRAAPWRERVQEPTPAQLSTARRLRVPLRPEYTRAQLSELIGDAIFEQTIRRASFDG